MNRRALLLLGWLALPSLLAQTPPAGYERVAALIRHELDDKKIPSIAIAVVDRERVLWAQGFGYADPKQLTPATANTIYRAGELSELLTLRAIRQLPLDPASPVARYLPGFPHPALTIRQLMEHRGGLGREPAVGSYYDNSSPTLAATVASVPPDPPLTGSPENRYSAAGIAILGRLIEQQTGRPFAEYMQQQVLDPLGMTHSSFVRTPAVRDALALGVMWAFDRAPWEAPVFDLGTAPANNLYTSASDMARFLIATLKEQRGSTPFDVRNGSLYGFSATLLTDPRQHRGVLVFASKDGATTITQAIAHAAIRDPFPRRRWPARAPDSTRQPAEDNGEWRSLIGEYGPDYNVVYLFERGGGLHALVNWVEDITLQPIAAPASRHTFRFPLNSRYAGETLSLGSQGLRIGAVTLPRRNIGGADTVFRIEPVRPVAALRAEAAKLSPPREAGLFRPQELVDLTRLDPAIKLDIRYATGNNFLSSPSYTSARAFMQRPAAEALLRAHQKLRALGFGLLIHDAYRPWTITKVFWDATPPAQHEFVADPAKGSRHNRGCAVDLTLYDLKTGAAVEMTGLYDEMSDRSYPYYPGGTSLQRWRRDTLRRAMEAEGFTVETTEWWHFNYRDWPFYRIGNESFEELEKEGKARTHR